MLDEILKLLHPFMPFVTEELWAIKGAEGPARDSVLALAAWPEDGSEAGDAGTGEVAAAIALISDIRSVRSELNVPAASLIPLRLSESVGGEAWVGRWGDTLKRLARVSDIAIGGGAPNGAVPVAGGDVAGVLPLAGIIDVAAEQARLAKEIGKVDAEAAKIDAKLGNADFVARAPEEVIEENRERRATAAERLVKLSAALARLTDMQGA